MTYYVYQYLNPDNTPYYIGKGKDRRATQRHLVAGKNIVPDNPDRIRILAKGLSEHEALRLEELLITRFGRQHRGGLLRNKRNRGEPSAQVFTAETREKMSQAKLGKARSKESKEKQSESAKEFWKTYDSTERDKKISQTNSGKFYGDREVLSKAAKKRERPPVSCLKCQKQGRIPTMTTHFNICNPI